MMFNLTIAILLFAIAAATFQFNTLAAAVISFVAIYILILGWLK